MRKIQIDESSRRGDRAGEMPDCENGILHRFRLSRQARRSAGFVSLAILISGFGCAVKATAQIALPGRIGGLGNPEVDVRVRHAPGLGLNFKRVAFITPAETNTAAALAGALAGAATGECAQRMEDKIGEILSAAGIEIIEREQFRRLLQEQAIANSDAIDSASAVRLGKLLGPSVLISIKVYRCSTERSQTVARGIVGPTYTSKTTAYVRGAVRTIDLETGRVFRPHSLEETVSKENHAKAGIPEHPAEVETQDEVIRKAAVRASSLFVPWQESRRVTFFDDGDCDLKAAFRLLKGGDIEAVLQKSLSNLEACKEAEKKPKVLSHAYYNVGLTYLLRSDFDQAIEYLQKSVDKGGGTKEQASLQEARRAKALAAEAKRVEESGTYQGTSASSPPEKAKEKVPVSTPADAATGREPKTPETQPKAAEAAKEAPAYQALDGEVGTVVRVSQQSAAFTVIEGVVMAVGEVLDVRRPQTVTDPRTGRVLTIADPVGTITVREIRPAYIQGDFTGSVEGNDRIMKRQRAASVKTPPATPVKAPPPAPVKATLAPPVKAPPATQPPVQNKTAASAKPVKEVLK